MFFFVFFASGIVIEEMVTKIILVLYKYNGKGCPHSRVQTQAKMGRGTSF